jgi:hypothetical protein
LFLFVEVLEFFFLSFLEGEVLVSLFAGVAGKGKRGRKRGREGREGGRGKGEGRREGGKEGRREGGKEGMEGQEGMR